MCTTLRHDERVGPLAAAGADGPVRRSPCATTGCGELLTAADFTGTAPVRPAPARTHTTPAPAAGIHTRRPAARRSHRAARARARHRPMAPRRTGSSMYRHDSSATPMLAATCKAPRASVSRPLAGVVSTMMG